MTEPVRITLAGYAPETSSHGRALGRMAASLRETLGDRAVIEIEYNRLDADGQVTDLLDEVESGTLTACYLSTSYLADRVPELALVDLPYTFGSVEHAHACLDGDLGEVLSARTRELTGLLPFGYWDNGVRHLSNSVRPVLSPADCVGLRIRLQPNWAHVRYFEELGAIPVATELRDGIRAIVSGEVDAQENPLANYVAYGVQNVHPYLTLTAHAYGARGVYVSAAQLESWTPDQVEALELAVAEAVRRQRAEAAAGELALRASLEAEGIQIVEPGAEELHAFEEAAAPVSAEARLRLSPELFHLVAR